MTYRDLTILTIKISGVVLFVLVVSRFPEYLKSYLNESSSEGLYKFWAYFLPIIIPGLISVFLFKFPSLVADQIITGSEGLSNDGFDFKKLEIVLIRVLGLLLCFYAISDLVFHLSNITQFSREPTIQFPLNAYNYSYLIATVVEFIFAFWLLVGTKGIVQILNKIRR